jgi:hypothetical protein
MLESSPQNKYSRRLYRDSSHCGPRFRLRWLFRNGLDWVSFSPIRITSRTRISKSSRRLRWTVIDRQQAERIAAQPQ